MLHGLQGKGSCNYIAYQARHEFPAPDALDFRLYGDPDEVRRQISVFNEVLSAVCGGAQRGTRRTYPRTGPGAAMGQVLAGPRLLHRGDALL